MIQPLKKQVIKLMPSLSHHDADLKIDQIRDNLETLWGEKIKIHQFEALEKTPASAGFKIELSEIDFKSIWGSRSGCRISMIAQKAISDKKSQGVLQEGNLDKIRHLNLSCGTA